MILQAAVGKQEDEAKKGRKSKSRLDNWGSILLGNSGKLCLYQKGKDAGVFIYQVPSILPAPRGMGFLALPDGAAPGSRGGTGSHGQRKPPS